MDQILTEQDLNKSWNNISPSLWCLIASRARALLAQRDALRDEVSKNAGSIAALCEANQRMGREVEQAKKEAEFGRAAIEHAKALGIDTNKELGQQYRALRRDAESWRRMFPHGLWLNADEASKIVVRYHFLDKDTKEVVVKDNGAPRFSSTAVNPAKPGLQPMKCPCGGKIEFGRERVGYCQKCGASCRVMDPPPATGDKVNVKVGQYITLTEGSIPVPGHYFSDNALLSAYADGYLAGKGAK